MNSLRLTTFATLLILLVTLSCNKDSPQECPEVELPEIVFPQGDIPKWQDTVSDGTIYNMYHSLADGNAVILDFSAVWCPPCAVAAPKVDSIYSYFGNGNNNVKVFEFLLQDRSYNSTDATDLNNWETQLGLSMPGFYNCLETYNEYENVYGTSIPLILVFIPNEDRQDPGNSTLVYNYISGLGVTGGLNTVYSDIKAILQANGF